MLLFGNPSNKHESGDAEGYLPVESDTANLAEAQKELARLEADFPLLAEISDGKEVTFEAEHSLQKPVGPCRNVARAANQNRRTIFMVADGTGSDRLQDRDVDNPLLYWANRLYKIIANPPFVRSVDTYTDDDGTQHTNRILYNTTDKFHLADDPMEKKYPVVQRGKEVVWVEEDEATLKLYNGRGEDAGQRAMIPANGLDEATANAFQVWTRYDQYEDEWVVYPEQGANKRYVDKDAMEEEWMIVRRPFHPRTDIGEDYEELDPMITILRDEDSITSVEDAMPLVYEREDPDTKPTARPLIPEPMREAWDADRVPGYDPVDDTPEKVRGGDDNDAYLAFQAFLDKYDVPASMITDELFPETPVQYDPNHTPDTDFGGNVTPTMREYWEDVFETASDEEFIEDARLNIETAKDGIEQGRAQVGNKEEAIRAGVKAGQLYVVDGGVMLASGWERPKAILNDRPQVYEAVTTREFWLDVYQQIGDGADDTFEKEFLAALADGVKDFGGGGEDHVAWARAAVQRAMNHDVLLPVDESENPQLELCAPGISDRWKKAWRMLGAKFDDAVDVEKLSQMVAARPVFDPSTPEDAETYVKNCLTKQKELQEVSGGKVKMVPPGQGGPLDDSEIIGDDYDPDDESDADETGESADANDAEGSESTDKKNVEGSESDREGTGGGTAAGSSDADTTDSTAGGSGTSPYSAGGGEGADTAEATGDAATDQPDSEVEAEAESAVDAEAAGAADRGDAVDTDDAGTDSDDGDDEADATEDDTEGDVEGEDDGPSIAADALTHASESMQRMPAEELPIGSEAKTAQAAQYWSVFEDVCEAEPDGWMEALSDTLERYHELVDEEIEANKDWNQLFDGFRDDHYADGGCDEHGHDSYVPQCRSCTLPGTCDECGEDAAIVRVEFTACDDHSNGGIPQHGCDAASADEDEEWCTTATYCAACCIEEELEPFADGSPSESVPAETHPLVYSERHECHHSYHSSLEECIENVTPPDSVSDRDGCHAGANVYEAPVPHLPETPREYLTQPDAWASDELPIADDPATYNASEDVSNPAHTVHRGYDDATIDMMKLGWAPGTKPWEKPIIDELLDEEGYSVKQLLATGLFSPDKTNISKRLHQGEPDSDVDRYRSDKDRYEHYEIAGIDLESLLEDASHPLEERDLLKPRWGGRYIFPFYVDAAELAELGELFDFPFDADAIDTAAAAIPSLEAFRAAPDADPDEVQDEGEGRVPIFAYAREQPLREHPNDTSGGKYQKPMLNSGGDRLGYVYIHEALYGIDTVEEGEPVVITEGVADAVAAIEAGMPVLSPVAAKLKDTHMEPLDTVLSSNNVETVRVIQDNEPSSFSETETSLPGDAELGEVLREAVAQRDAWRESDATTLEAELDKIYDDDVPDSETDDVLVEHGGVGGGPVAAEVKIDKMSTGLEGAVAVEELLVGGGYDVQHGKLPSLATSKIDLDEYLTSGLVDHAPAYPSLSALDAVIVDDDERDEVAGLVVEGAAFRMVFYDGLRAASDAEIDERMQDAVVASGERAGPDNAIEAPGRPNGEPAWVSRLLQREKVGVSVPYTVTDDGEIVIESLVDSDGSGNERLVDSDGSGNENLVDGDGSGSASMEDRDGSGGSDGGEDDEELEDPVWFVRERLPGVAADAPEDGGTVDAMAALLAYADEHSDAYAAAIDGLDADDCTVREGIDSIRETVGHELPDSLTAFDSTGLLDLGTPTVLVDSIAGVEESDASRDERRVDPPRTESVPVRVSDAAAGGRVEERPLLLPSLRFVDPESLDHFGDVLQSKADERQQQAGANATAMSDGGDMNGRRSALYDLELATVTGLDEGFRGKNPMGDRGESNNYFKMYGRNSGYDFKRTWMYNALLYLLVECGERSVDDPYGSLSPEEHLAAWVYAKQQGFISGGDKVPNAALNAAAVELGVCEWDDIGPKEVQVGEDEPFTIPEAVPDPEYAEVLKQFEDAYGVPAGRFIPTTEVDFEVDGLTTEESVDVFAERFMKQTDDEADQLKKSYGYPRMPVSMVWETYEYWCEEINNIEARNDKYAKKELADVLDVEKGSAPYAGMDGRVQCYKQAKFSNEGYDLYKFATDE